jgi:transcriptional regulator with XRE-family HTH domain
MGQGKRSDRRDGLGPALGLLLKARREAADLSLHQLSVRTGVTSQYLSRLERGQYANPSLRVLTQLARNLDIRAEDLYAITGCILPVDLPSFSPYLRAKHPDWPELVVRELTDFYCFLKQKHSLR